MADEVTLRIFRGDSQQSQMIDYRVPVDQSYQLFTALQLNKVDSKLIVFPDEGHWILKPQNSQFWYAQVLEWFGKHLRP